LKFFFRILANSGDLVRLLLRNTECVADGVSLELAMLFSHRHRIAAVALLVYLSSVLGAGLHHHDHGEAFAIGDSVGLQPRLAERTIQSSSPTTSTHEDADGCTLCTALHQAKALTIAVSTANGIALVGEADILSVESPIAPIPIFQQARAPPLSSHFMQ
jgi:hypothetical protein